MDHVSNSQRDCSANSAGLQAERPSLLGAGSEEGRLGAVDRTLLRCPYLCGEVTSSPVPWPFFSFARPPPCPFHWRTESYRTSRKAWAALTQSHLIENPACARGHLRQQEGQERGAFCVCPTPVLPFDGQDGPGRSRSPSEKVWQSRSAQPACGGV